MNWFQEEKLSKPAAELYRKLRAERIIWDTRSPRDLDVLRKDVVRIANDMDDPELPPAMFWSRWSGFEVAGIVSRCEFGDGQSRFEMIAGGCGAGHHHHHLVCRRCGAAVEFEGCDLSALFEQIGGATGYCVDEHLLELVGLCPACR